jgi:cell division protease FtsH
MIFHDPTTGASNDIEKATAMARKMVTEYGMTERVGAIKLGQSQGEVFLGRDMGHQRDYSEEVAADRRRGGAPPDRVRPTTRPGTSSTTTGTSWTGSCWSCSRRRPSTPRTGRRDLRGPSASAPSADSGSPASTALLSDKPPVLTPAEQAAALNGSGRPRWTARSRCSDRGDQATEAAIDRAARGRSLPYARTSPSPR